MTRQNKKKLLLSFTAMALLGFIYIFFAQKTIEERITDGTLSYSQELGWINWNHAIPNSTQEAWQQFKAGNKRCDSTFNFVYSQRMGFDCIAFKFYAYESKNNLVKKIYSDTLEQQVFFEIFKKVSNAFEKMQGRFPQTLVGFRTDSDFREGDLMGNLISFHLAINNISLKEFRNQLTLDNEEQALKRYSNNGLKKVYWKDLETQSLPLFPIMNLGLDISEYYELTNSTFEYKF